MTLLHFHFEPEDEWHGKLSATVETGGFAGKGVAWFSTEELRDFGKELSAFPLRIGSLPFITGGFGAKEDAPGQVHLAVSLEPHNVRGEIRVCVKLATEVWNDEAADLACSATVRFLATYADLGRFSPEFLDLIEGRRTTAALQSFDGQ